MQLYINHLWYLHVSFLDYFIVSFICTKGLLFYIMESIEFFLDDI